MRIETTLPKNEVQMVRTTVTFDGTAGKGLFTGNFGEDYALLVQSLPGAGAAGANHGILALRVDVIVTASLVGAAGTTLSLIGEGYTFDAATNISTMTTGTIWTAGAATTGAVAMGTASKEIVMGSNDPYLSAVPDIHSVTGGTIRCDFYYLPMGQWARGAS